MINSCTSDGCAVNACIGRPDWPQADQLSTSQLDPADWRELGILCMAYIGIHRSESVRRELLQAAEIAGFGRPCRTRRAWCWCVLDK